MNTRLTERWEKVGVVAMNTLFTGDVNNRAWMHRTQRGLPHPKRCISELMDSTILERGPYCYVEEGEGTPLVLLHGLFGALSNFQEVRAHFSKSFRVITPMLPIYEPPMLETNVKNMAKHIAGFLDELGLEKVHLLGNSLGGNGLIYTRDHLDRVASLTLTPAAGSTRTLVQVSAAGGQVVHQGQGRRTFHDPKHATPELVDVCFEAVIYRYLVLSILSIAMSAIRQIMAKDLPSMNVPVCLIWGKNDIITPPEVAEEFLAGFPDADLHWIDECGHAPMMEHPDTFNQILSDWFASRGIS